MTEPNPAKAKPLHQARIDQLLATLTSAGMAFSPVFTRLDRIHEVFVYGDGQLMGSVWFDAGKWATWKAPRLIDGRWSKPVGELHDTVGTAVQRLRPGKRIVQQTEGIAA